jgi:hypothetical protein
MSFGYRAFKPQEFKKASAFPIISDGKPDAGKTKSTVSPI